MLNLNRAMVIGNATRDAEIRYTPSGRAVTSFGIATNRRFTNAAGNQQEETEFHEIVAWGKLAEIASQIIKKGQRIYAEGRLRTRTWEGQDGTKRQRTEIIAENLINLSPRPETIAPPAEPAESAGPLPSQEKQEKNKKDKEEDKEEEKIDLEDIPF